MDRFPKAPVAINQFIERLNISDNPLTTSRPHSISESMFIKVANNQFIERLNISDNPLTTSLGDTLGKAMAVNKSLVALNVASVGLVNASSLSERSLNVASVGLVNASTLFAGLRPPLKALNVANNTCAPASWNALNVANNTCAPASWNVLGESMAAGLALSSLKPRGNVLGESMAVGLALSSLKVPPNPSFFFSLAPI
ncbi:hypothetical protein T484DRAFT_1769030 [Baffinella frigidus]|nr:hypothetical protein T484DRAFT_1769030 [Cryptophyta sp. CCMP2293]